MVDPRVPADDLSGYLQRHEEPHLEYLCEKCGVKGDTRRIELLKQLRECIVVMYNKFLHKQLATFPETLMMPTFPRGTFLRYDLVAQIEHIGGMNGGHYYAIARRDGKWYNMNDSSVHESHPQATSNTFMLFYNIVKQN
jgi:ubiquitin C-terminal hydrolase